MIYPWLLSVFFTGPNKVRFVLRVCSVDKKTKTEL